jgi:L,D-transpeptidase YcbB
MKLPQLIIIVLALVLGNPALAEVELRELIRHRLEHMLPEQTPVAAGQSLFAAPAVQRLYLERVWLPIWFDDQGQPRPLLEQVLNTLSLADEHGLDSAHYHQARLVELIESVNDADPATRIDVELLATDALMTLGTHLAFGKVDHESIDPGWMIEREPPELMARLNRRSSADVQLRSILESLLPQHQEYHALVDRLALQRRLLDEGDWPQIESGPALRPGDHEARLSQIRQRLLALGDLVEHGSADPDTYDEGLEPAVQQFQHRHGLNPDGIIGRNTLAALNVSPRSRIDQLRANLERWRWLPASLGEEYILVNIAGFDMHVVSGGERVMEQRVVVGQPYRRTPVFTGRMTYLVLNPSWEVPHRLASQDQLPRIQENPAYLEEMGFAVLRGWGSEEVRIDPAEVDWSALSRRNFPFRLRQAPGPQNALGQVKFMFPNRHNVYLHDSPARGLYALEDRARSSGCIRLEQPERLTEWLLNERASLMSTERIAAVLDSGRETTVRLDRPLAVHLLYWTAWVDQHGQVQYRRDVYQRDGALLDALDAAPAFPDPS